MCTGRTRCVTMGPKPRGMIRMSPSRRASVTSTASSFRSRRQLSLAAQRRAQRRVVGQQAASRQRPRRLQWQRLLWTLLLKQHCPAPRPTLLLSCAPTGRRAKGWRFSRRRWTTGLVRKAQSFNTTATSHSSTTLLASKSRSQALGSQVSALPAPGGPLSPVSQLRNCSVSRIDLRHITGCEISVVKRFS